MKFELVRPCANCPFRSDIPGYLTRARAFEIANALLTDASFTCHKTNVYEEDGVRETPDSQHCAGALIFLEAQDRSNQMMRWMERIGCYDRAKLDMDAPVFHDARAFIEHHAPTRGREGT